MDSGVYLGFCSFRVAFAARLYTRLPEGTFPSSVLFLKSIIAGDLMEQLKSDRLVPHTLLWYAHDRQRCRPLSHYNVECLWDVHDVLIF
ncbi:hypothetical protein CGRA01v4_03808 [Colletotrichum graminicola]|nr:hypothetical protein CGRA01v4_03808 [Colletotrichum graminicola]